MAQYSKLIAAIIGGVLSWLTVRFGLPAEWSTGEFAVALSTVIMSILVWRFPANEPAE